MYVFAYVSDMSFGTVILSYPCYDLDPVCRCGEQMKEKNTLMSQCVSANEFGIFASGIVNHKGIKILLFKDGTEYGISV